MLWGAIPVMTKSPVAIRSPLQSISRPDTKVPARSSSHLAVTRVGGADRGRPARRRPRPAANFESAAAGGGGGRPWPCRHTPTPAPHPPPARRIFCRRSPPPAHGAPPRVGRASERRARTRRCAWPRRGGGGGRVRRGWWAVVDACAAGGGGGDGESGLAAAACCRSCPRLRLHLCQSAAVALLVDAPTPPLVVLC